jgi:threonine synthase
MWRYGAAIPVEGRRDPVTLGEGSTPLVPAEIAGRSVLLKHEQVSPTGSFKDRGASVLVTHARDLGIARVVEDSSGNAGSALSAYCSRAGIECKVFVPEGTAPEKVRGMLDHGAEVVQVKGDRAAAEEAAHREAATAYYAGHAWNPFFLHGTKTAAFEIAEELGWRSPDTVVVPVGNGTLLLGLWIGFCELAGAGLVGGIPRLVGVQAAACDPIHKAFIAGLKRVPPRPACPTAARGIAVARPARGPEILSAIRDSGGTVVTVGEAEIRTALSEMQSLGLEMEPTSAAGIAGLKIRLEDIPPGKTVVSFITGGPGRVPNRIE